MHAKPLKKQLDFLNWEYGMFFHFGIRSFNPGHEDWDNIEMAPETFNPDKLDCNQWMKVAKEAGAKYTIMTTKHHDGFALWPSKYSNYSVANSPWKNGKGDVVKEYVEACRANGIKVGLYYSPAQWGKYSFNIASDKEYDDYFINQISELLSNYGKIDYLWFDGCGSQGHIYDKERIIKEIFRLQPDILTFYDADWAPGIRWVGNEDGYAPVDNWMYYDKSNFAKPVFDDGADDYFLPSECDCRLRSTWFYDKNEDTIKSLDELFAMYEMSVGNSANFLLNIGPDNHGLICDADVKRLRELTEKIKSTYGNALGYSEMEKESENKYSVKNITSNTFKDIFKNLANRIVLSEDLTDGQHIKEFKIYAYPPFAPESRVMIYQGTTVGHKKICMFGAIRASKYELEITSSDGDYTLTDFKVYFAK